MRDIALLFFVLAFIAAGFKRPFLWVLAYAYIDIVAPQRFTYFLLNQMNVSLVAFALAVIGWAAVDDKRGSVFGFRQVLILLLLLICGMTTLSAEFPDDALNKWSWVWKSLIFAIFLPLTLRTKLRLESLALILVLSAATIIIVGGIKTILSGGGYGVLRLLVDDNSGLYEGSIISCVAIAIIPLVLWLTKHGTIFPSDWRVRWFGYALVFACLLIPVGTQARTGLICIAALGVLALRTVKHRFLYIGGVAIALAAGVPMLPDSFTSRMSTINDYQGDQSAGTRLAVWKWTWDYAKDNPFGGGFDVYRKNELLVKRVITKENESGAQVQRDSIKEKGRAFHSSYFELLGEQGFLGLGLWLLLHLLGVVHMEKIRSRYQRSTDPADGWISPLANALQLGQIIYLVGSLFVGIAYQPFIYMLVALQCGLHSYLARREDRERVGQQNELKADREAKRAARQNRGGPRWSPRA